MLILYHTDINDTAYRITEKSGVHRYNLMNEWMRWKEILFLPVKWDYKT